MDSDEAVDIFYGGHDFVEMSIKKEFIRLITMAQDALILRLLLQA